MLGRENALQRLAIAIKWAVALPRILPHEFLCGIIRNLPARDLSGLRLERSLRKLASAFQLGAQGLNANAEAASQPSELDRSVNIRC